ncbi:subtilisin-like serine protease QhpE [Azospirillum sp.]|uniref:subtilisin-like serine protease QhpE n=1 Tax=Azospirillum sp. TaxID=34012 RepID=UPI002D38D52C|nr:hypothetical protein [Azospirillum sp.]HYD64061.1 hypothetical protein [Azospirillum sp.]
MRIALVDSGIGDASAVARAAFALGETGVEVVAPRADPIGHGTAIAAILRAAVPDAGLIDAQIFLTGPATSAAQAAAALRWAVEQGAQLVGMSFGLPADRAVLAGAVAWAAERGVVMAASAPARGGMVWPAAYPAVIAASGDARCAPGEVSVLPGLFGACPRRLDELEGPPRAGGASLAVGHLLAVLAQGGVTGHAEAVAHLRRVARWHGRERKILDG